MTDKITDKTLAIVGTVGSFIASYCLSPQCMKWQAPFGVLAVAGAILFAQGQWVQSGADEWLLVIRDGKLVKSGIGMKTFMGITDTVVKFPSRVERVNFTANNVTKEMQGVQITGFAFWSVHRQEDGPFRCYKYMEGNNANANVQAMCESVLRSQIANSSLDEVLRKRDLIRDNIRNQLRDQFKGWGVWLETVEITEVVISSEKLFKDLQADYRQKTRLHAERIELDSSQKITEARQASNMRTLEFSEDVQTKKKELLNTELLKRTQALAKFDEKKNQLDIKRMEQQKQIQIQRYNNNFLIQQANLEKDQTLNKMRQDYEKEEAKKLFEVDKEHNEMTLAKYQIDSMEKILKAQNLRGVSINQFSGGDKNSMAAFLPGIGFGMTQMKQA